jgi:serine/threonine protein kinase
MRSGTVPHQSLVVHRDLKPGNILVTAGGTPKLLDLASQNFSIPNFSFKLSKLAEP